MKRIKLVLSILVLVIALTVSVTFAWYQNDSMTQSVQTDGVEISLIDTEGTDKQLVPEGYVWFAGQTDSYVYTYQFTGQLIEGKTLDVEYTFGNIKAPATLELFEKYFVVDSEVQIDGGNTLVVITVSLLEAENRGDYNKLRNATLDISFNFILK